METITLEINEKSNIGKVFKKMILAFVNDKEIKISENPRYNSTTEKAIKEAQLGIGVTKTKSHADLMKKLRS